VAGDSARFSNLAAGNYTYTVRDNNGCTTTGTFRINPLGCNVTITTSVTNVLCNGGSTGRIILTATGGTGTPTVVWSDASIGNTLTANNLRAGTYSATVTYPNGCSANTTATVTTPSVLATNFRKTDITQTSPPNGSVAIGVSGGTPPYRVILNTDSLLIAAGDSARFSNLAAGNYTYMVRDNNGCTTTGIFTINPLGCNVTLTQAITNVLCNGGSTGRIILTATGGTGTPTVVWSDASIGNTLTANNLRAGTYSATVTYPNGCSATATATVTTPSVLATNFRKTDITQTSPPNGSVAIGVSGGTPPYRVILNTDSLLIAAGDSARFSNLAVGNYTYTVRDNNGCTTMGTFTINPLGCNLSAPISLNISRDSVCNGTSVTLTTPSVNQAVSYRWQTPIGVVITSTPNLSINNVSNSYSGIYTLTLSFNGCESQPSPSVRLTVVDVSTQRVFAGLDKTECGNTTTNLTATPLINASFTGNWQSLNAAIIAQTNQSSTAVSGLKSGNNGFVWSVSSAVCGLVGRDTMLVYVEKMPTLTETTLRLDSKSSSLLVNMRELLRDSFNFSISITPPNQGFAQIQNGRFLFFDRANLTAAQRIEIPYRLCGLQCPNLCANSKLIIDVAATELDSQALDVQKLLSSNGSTSAFLEIKGTELLDEVECIIVDRWGTRVFGPVSYQNNTVGRAWDGTKNGKQLPNGAYYYSLKYTAKATKRVQRGIIYLVDGL
jgi:gliding motility-associated-like protein